MATDFVAEAFSYLAIAIIFIFLRLYFSFVKGGGFKGIGLDDLFMIGAGVSICSDGTVYFPSPFLFRVLAKLILGARQVFLCGRNSSGVHHRRVFLGVCKQQHLARGPGELEPGFGGVEVARLRLQGPCHWMVYIHRCDRT